MRVCCCSPELGHNEAMKFVLLRKEVELPAVSRKAPLVRSLLGNGCSCHPNGVHPPDAGSSAAGDAAVALPQADGTWSCVGDSGWVALIKCLVSDNACTS